MNQKPRINEPMAKIPGKMYRPSWNVLTHDLKDVQARYIGVPTPTKPSASCETSK